MAAILDLNRDVPALARLLESSDVSVRGAAVNRLKELTGENIPSPKDRDAQSLERWSEVWSRAAKPSQSVRWPPLRTELKESADEFPDDLLQAVRNDDAIGFSKAFGDWLDSGVARDRGIYRSRTLNRAMVMTNNLIGVVGGSVYLPPAPHLRPEVLLNTNIAAEDRMEAIALLAEYYHCLRFTAERAEAVTWLGSKSATSEMLRRAAFWEQRDANITTPGLVALNRLAGNDGEYRPIDNSEARFELNQLAESDKADTQRFLLALCFEQRIDDNLLCAVRVEIKAGRHIFVNGLLDYLQTHRDDHAQWVGRILCQEKKEQVIPIMLAWLKDTNAPVRAAAANNLCWLPSEDAVPVLIESIHCENELAVKAQMLEALAQTDDPRGLETLLTAVRESRDPRVMDELVRGLGRIRDPKALAPLADIVSELAWLADEKAASTTARAAPGTEIVLADAVNASGYISYACEAHVPDIFYRGSGNNTTEESPGIAYIKQWQKSRTGKL